MILDRPMQSCFAQISGGIWQQGTSGRHANVIRCKVRGFA